MASLLHHRHTLPELRSAVPGDEQVARLEDWLGFSIPEGTHIGLAGLSGSVTRDPRRLLTLE